jgi:hypothetical protein
LAVGRDINRARTRIVFDEVRMDCWRCWIGVLILGNWENSRCLPAVGGDGGSQRIFGKVERESSIRDLED